MQLADTISKVYDRLYVIFSDNLRTVRLRYVHRTLTSLYDESKLCKLLTTKVHKSHQ